MGTEMVRMMQKKAEPFTDSVETITFSKNCTRSFLISMFLSWNTKL